jgi:hypothetical protein
MIYPSIRTLALMAALAAATLSLASTAQAAPFDGSWSVSVFTRSGRCGNHQFGVWISNGVISGSGASGRVTSSGSVSVSVSGAPGSAHGSGRLSRNSGGGSWRGSGSQGSCSGSWSARRG